MDDKIREGFAEETGKAPAGLWDSLAENLSAGDQALDREIKDSFQHDSSEAPDAVWAGINRQLTIDKAWQGINSYLKARQYLRWTARFAALLLIFLGIGAILQIANGADPSPEPVKVDLRDIPAGEGNTNLPAVVLDEETPPMMRSNEDRSSESPANNLNETTPATPRETGVDELYDETLASNTWVLNDTAPHPKDWLLLPWGPNLPELRNINREPEIHLPKGKRARFKHWDLGIIYSYQRDFLSNNAYRESLDQRSLISSSPVYSSNWAMELRYFIKPQWSLKIQTQFSDDVGLVYHEYAEGRYGRRELNLNYSRLGIGFDHHLPLSLGKQPFNLVLGAQSYYARLNVATLNEVDLSNTYQDAFGLQLHLGQEWHSGSMILSYGLLTDFNFNNLYRGSSNIPAAFDRTIYRSWGAYIGARYRF